MNDQQRDPWYVESDAAQAAVKCPTCKAEKGQPCIHLATNTGVVHFSRRTKFQKATAK